MEVFVPLFCFNQTCNTNYMLAVIALIQKFQELNIKLTLYPILSESLVSRGRNAAVAHFMGSSATHMFFVDSDIIFNPSDVVKLLNSDKPVIGGIYPKKVLKSQDNSFQVEFTAKGKVEIENDLCLVDYIPSGFLCIRRDAIEKLVQKNPELKYTNDVEAYHSDDCVEHYYDFFKPGVNSETKLYMGEDEGFCKLLSDAGVPLYVYPNITLAHIGNFNYIGNFQELINAQISAQTKDKDSSSLTNTVITEEDEYVVDGGAGNSLEDTD